MMDWLVPGTERKGSFPWTQQCQCTQPWSVNTLQPQQSFANTSHCWPVKPQGLCHGPLLDKEFLLSQVERWLWNQRINWKIQHQLAPAASSSLTLQKAKRIWTSQDRNWWWIHLLPTATPDCKYSPVVQLEPQTHLYRKVASMLEMATGPHQDLGNLTFLNQGLGHVHSSGHPLACSTEL